MLPDDTRSKIENITKGVILEGQSDHCAAARNLLCNRYPTSTTVKKDFESQAIIKKEQGQKLEQFCTDHGLWMTKLPTEATFLTRGGEARIYLHNLIFSNTAYELVGFTKEDETLIAVLKQPFIISDDLVELNDIKLFLEYNEFVNTRRHDYEHKQLGLILEDMHDENVLVNSETLFFIL